MLRFIISIFILFSVTVFANSNVRVNELNSGQSVVLSSQQILEIRLYSPNAGSGCCWSVSKMASDVLREFGEWEFEQESFVDEYGAPAVGVPDGYQIIRFAGVKAGTTELTLEYKRPWEKNSPALETYSINVQSAGTYCGSAKEYDPARAVVAGDPTTTSFSKTYPERYNLMDFGVLTPVKDQKIDECGSCWAHGTCAVFETLIKAKDGIELDLSEQWFVNCDETSYGCNGGWCAFKYFVSHGCVYEEDEPYIAVDDDCDSYYPYHEKATSYKRIYNSSFIPPVDSLKKYIYEYGSLVVCCRYNNSQFLNYTGGLFTYNDNRTVDHILELVGWDDSEGGFWFVKNSFGVPWGEEGYMRIKWGVSGIGTNPYYLVYGTPLGPLTTGNLESLYSHGQQNLLILPKPGSGNFTIKVDSPRKTKHALSIMDIRGRTVFTDNVIPGISKEISLGNLAKGLYLVEVTGPGIRFQRRIIIK